MPVVKRGNRWHAVIELGPDPLTGKRRQRSRVAGTTKKSAQELLTKLQRERDTGTLIDPTALTVAAYLNEWLEATKRPQVRPSTYERYALSIRRQIVPYIGGLRLPELTTRHLSNLYTTLQRQGLSASTIQHAAKILHGSLDQAVRWQMVSRNVAALVNPGLRRSPPVAIDRLWTVAQVQQFLTLVTPRPDGLVYVLALTTGLRRGELLGLRWGAVDLVRGELAVVEQRSRQRGGTAVSPLKTTGSRRVIVLDADTTALLRQHQARHTSPYVIVGDHGQPLSPSRLHRRWQKLLAETGLPRIRFHDLRHLNATMLLNAGVHPKVVQERLGHSSITMTLDRYSHVSRDLQAAANQALATWLAAQKSESVE